MEIRIDFTVNGYQYQETSNGDWVTPMSGCQKRRVDEDGNPLTDWESIRSDELYEARSQVVEDDEEEEEDDEMKETLKELLKEHLQVELKEVEDMYSRDLVVTVSFDGEEIASSSHQLEHKGW